MDSRLHKTFFVDRGGGFFEPRPVETGWRFGDRVEIVKGLSAGDRIVLSGSFLLDSETRMKNPAASVVADTAPTVDPVCGMPLGPASAGAHTFAWNGTTYHFCSDHCRRRFQEHPERFMGAGRAL
jgi:membrane fusion protein, copper/silver efflux system